MPILTSGGTTTVTLGAYDSITLQNRSGQAASISVGGAVVNGNHSGSRTYGPYPSGGSVSLNAISGDLYYEVADGAGDTKRVFARGSALLAEDGSTVSAGGRAIFSPPSNDTAGILVAAYAAKTAGGGIVDLRGMDVTLTTSLPLYDGVIYQGNRGDYQFNGMVPETNITPLGGTILRGDGTFPAFRHNDAEDTNTYPVASVWTNSGVANAGACDMFITGFSRGLSVGGLKAAGAWYCKFTGLHIFDCTDWGVWLENFQHCNIDVHVGRCDVGQVWLGSSGDFDGPDFLNPGNTIVNRIFALKKRTWDSRGVVIQSRGPGGVVNDLCINKLQVNGGINEYLFDIGASFTSGSSSIAVDDVSKFRVGSYFTVKTTVAGFAQWGTYCVRSVSGASGAGTITCALDHFTEPLKAATATTSGTLTVQGYPLLEILGKGITQKVQPLTVNCLDLENDATAAVYMERAEVNLLGHLVNSGRKNGMASSYVARYSNGYIRSHHHVEGKAYFDLDSTQKSRLQISSILGHHDRQGEGFYRGSGISISSAPTSESGVGTGQTVIHGGGNSPYSMGCSDRGFLRINDALGLKPRVMTGTAANVESNGKNCVIALNMSSGATFTLTAIIPNTLTDDLPNGTVGRVYYLSNPTANPITVASGDASQPIIGAGASNTSRTLPANSTVMVIAQQRVAPSASAAASDCYWAWFGA